jgi:PD-(D/E)XK nuclease superfamily protein
MRLTTSNQTTTRKADVTNTPSNLPAADNNCGDQPDNSRQLVTSAPRLKNTRKQRGEVAESVFLAKSVSMGFGVAKPWGDSERYDFILDSGGQLWRVQLKSAYRGCKHGGYTVHAFGNQNRTPYTAAEIDVVIAYIVPEDAWYVIPIAAFGSIHSMKLFPASRRRRSRHEKYREGWCLMACKPDGPQVRRKCVNGLCRFEELRNLDRRL